MYTETAPAPATPDSLRSADGRATRGSERRVLLLDTALRLIAERGLDAVNHRSVAEAAGVPLGSTTYWFDSRQHMLTASLEHFVRLEIAALNERLAEIANGTRSRRRLAEEFTALLAPQLGEERWRTAAQYTLLVEAPRYPELQDVCREWTDAWNAALADLFAELGVSSPALEARMFLGMLDGLLLAQLATPEPDAEKKLIRPAIERWFSRLTQKGPAGTRRGQPKERRRT